MKTENHVAFQNTLSVPDILNLYKISRNTLYLRIKNGTFPAPAKNGTSRLIWSEEVIKKHHDEMLGGAE